MKTTGATGGQHHGPLNRHTRMLARAYWTPKHGQAPRANRLRMTGLARPWHHLSGSLLFPLLVLTLATLLPAADPDTAQLKKDTGCTDGLAVFIEPAQPDTPLALAAEGKILVHCLHRDAAATTRFRQAFFSKGLYGMATAETWIEPARLPFADRLVNLLVADLDALGAQAPSTTELDRVVAPSGALYLKKDGAWKTTKKPRPATFGDWGHFDFAADGNAVSPDTAIGVPTQLQWLAGIQAVGLSVEGNPAGYDPGAGLRVWGRYCVLDTYDQRDPKQKITEALIECRDAFNGLTLWSRPRDRGVSGKRWSLVAHGGQLFTWLKTGGELTALDLATGEVLRTYPGTTPMDAGKNGPVPGRLPEEENWVRVTDRHVVLTVNEKLLCFETATAKPLWTFARDGKKILAPSLSEDAASVFVIVARPERFRARWPTCTTVEAVVALDLTTGKERWSNTDVASIDVPGEKGKTVKRGISQLIPGGGKLFAFGSKAIGGGESPYIAVLSAMDGKTLYQKDGFFPTNYNSYGYNAVYRDDALYFAGAFFMLWRFNPQDFKLENLFTRGGGNENQRCPRFNATKDLFIFGRSAWIDRENRVTQLSTARSGCAIGNIPANGMTYFTPNACGCITQLRGFQAQSPEALPPALPDALRLEKASGPQPAVAVPGAPPKTLLAAEWLRHRRATAPALDPVKAGDMEIICHPHEHLIEARAGGKTKWTFVAGGRVTQAPLVKGDALFFGSHDGRVYGLALADGALRWRSLVAPALREIVVCNQLESSWPVYGVVEHDGLIAATAGTHPELGGGVFAAGLKPETGEAVWQKTLRKQAMVMSGKEGANSNYSFINNVPRVRDGQILLGDGGRVGGEFTFTPKEEDAALAKRLSAPPEKKK